MQGMNGKISTLRLWKTKKSIDFILQCLEDGDRPTKQEDLRALVDSMFKFIDVVVKKPEVEDVKA
jgi:hypothetical protein